MYYKVTTYYEAFTETLGIKFDDKLKSAMNELEKEGYKEKNIAYAIWKSREKLLFYLNDDRFINILKNEVRKTALTQEQWNKYWKEKNKTNAKR